MQYTRLWIALALVIVGSCAVLGSVGVRAVTPAPPIPQQVVSVDGQVLFERSTIQRGQGVWQSLGGQQIGSIWGHGAYIAPDWTADWLHREAVARLDRWARDTGAADFAALSGEQQAALQARLQDEMRTDTYDPATGRLRISAARAEVFAQGRAAYAIPRGALTDPVKARHMATFWWTAWAASTNRPGQEVTYTQNWPHEPLVGNTPTGSAVVGSVISFVLLLAGIGGMVWYFAAQERGPVHTEMPTRDPLLGLEPTPSQRATVKYFFVVAALFVVQVGFGAIAAHYGVEGSGFYGIPLDQWLPYAVARTWHTQLGLFWIATSWLATGLYVAPAVSRYEPPGQRTGVNLLFTALLIVVVGSLLGEWFGIQQYLGDAWFWFGSQGYEYVDLGRFWQILLFVGLVFWLGLMVRALRTTPVHGHTALFGVYGMLGLGLVLFCLRGLRPGQAWKHWPLWTAFWGINVGLALMVLLSLLPIGLLQTWAAVEYGTWYARSAEFLQTGMMNTLRWLRVIGDNIFAIGALAFGWFVLGLATGHAYDVQGLVVAGEAEVRLTMGSAPSRTGEAP